MNYCYILFNERTNCTYNGYTTDLQRRLRQHNKEIKGGARYTTSRIDRVGRWQFLAHITTPSEESLSTTFTKRTALSLEWHIRYPTNKRPRPKQYNGPLGRIQSLPLAINNPKFAHIPHFLITVHPKYLDVTRELFASQQDRVTITSSSFSSPSQDPVTKIAEPTLRDTSPSVCVAL